MLDFHIRAQRVASFIYTGAAYISSGNFFSNSRLLLGQLLGYFIKTPDFVGIATVHL